MFGFKTTKSKIMFRTNVRVLILLASIILSVFFAGCKDTNNAKTDKDATNIIFLHHSTGHVIWKGQGKGISGWFGKNETLPAWFNEYNETNGTNFQIAEQNFPKAEPYGWNNYPYDYYNIWVQNAGNESYKDEPTLEMLTKDYDVIIFKHCFPVGNIQEDTGNPDPASPEKRLENYKAQYEALKEKINAFPETKFVLWTAAAHEKSNATEAEAMRTKEFVHWVINNWDNPDDNLYLWDFYSLETEGELYLKDEYVAKAGDSHPSSAFGKRVAPLLAARIVDVIETNGTATNLKGEPK
jgi:hypothetical protein